MENYEQKYKEALAKAKVVNPGTKDYNIVTAIFPELKESEDERIRKEIIHYLDREITLSNFGGDIATFKRWIAWLEKQGKQEQLYIRFGEIPTDEKSKIYQGEMEIGTENGVSVYPAFKTDKGDIVLGLCLPITKTTLYTQQHLIEYDDRPCYLVKGDYVGKDTDGQLLINNISIVEKIDSYRVKEEKQGNPTEKVEPKFKIGDWIVNNISKDIFLIKSYSSGYCTLEDTKGIFYHPCLPPNDEFHLWTIRDAKDGDILEFEDHGRLVTGIISFINRASEKVDTYCLLEEDKFKVGVFYTLDTINPHPVTAEQHKFFFKKMEEAGYRWDDIKKELIRYEQ